MLYLDVAALERHNYDQYLADILFGLDLEDATGRRLRAAFPEFFTSENRPQLTPWSFLKRRFNILEAYSHGEPTVATLSFFNLPLEEFFSNEVPAVWDIFKANSDAYEYKGLFESQPRILTLSPEEVEGKETRFCVLEIIPLHDTPDDDAVMVTALSLQYIDFTR